jgi:hypothetical protein
MLKGGLPTPAPLHRKEWLIKVKGFREGLQCSQERDLHLRLACAGATFRRLPELLYTVRRTSGSISSDAVRILDQHLLIVRSAFQLLQETGQLTEPRAKALAGLLAKDARAYLRAGRQDSASAYFDAAASLHAGGGLRCAYGAGAWLLRRLVGPALTEQLVGLKRSLLPR